MDSRFDGLDQDILRYQDAIAQKMKKMEQENENLQQEFLGNERTQKKDIENTNSVLRANMSNINSQINIMNKDHSEKMDAY